MCQYSAINGGIIYDDDRFIYLMCLMIEGMCKKADDLGGDHLILVPERPW